MDKQSKYGCSSSQHAAIQRANARDYFAVARLLESCDLPFEDLTEDHLEHFFVIKDRNNVLGCIGLETFEDEALLRSLAVSANERGQGFGKKLVQQIENYAKEQGINAIFLLTTTAKDFFNAHGYVQISRQGVPDCIQQSEEFANLCPANATVMKQFFE